MEGHVSWVNELTVKEGKLETFRELMEEMVSGTSNEPGTLAYEWYISHDGGTVHVVETYADSAAVGAHHGREGVAFQNWAGRGMGRVGGRPGVAPRGPQPGAREGPPRPRAPHYSPPGGVVPL